MKSLHVILLFSGMLFIVAGCALTIVNTIGGVKNDCEKLQDIVEDQEWEIEWLESQVDEQVEQIKELYLGMAGLTEWYAWYLNEQGNWYQAANYNRLSDEYYSKSGGGIWAP